MMSIPTNSSIRKRYNLVTIFWYHSYTQLQKHNSISQNPKTTTNTTYRNIIILNWRFYTQRKMNIRHICRYKIRTPLSIHFSLCNIYWSSIYKKKHQQIYDISKIFTDYHTFGMISSTRNKIYLARYFFSHRILTTR